MSSASMADDSEPFTIYGSISSSSDDDEDFSTPAPTKSGTPRRRSQGSESPSDLPPPKKGRGNSQTEENVTTNTDTHNMQVATPDSVFLENNEQENKEEEEENKEEEEEEKEEEKEEEEGIWELPRRRRKAKAKSSTPKPKPQARPRRRLNLQLPPPAFLSHPVVMKDVGTGTVKYRNLGPIVHKFWQQTVGEILSQRPLGADRWLIGCKSAKQQARLASTTNLAGVHVHCTIPDVKTTRVVQGIPPNTKAETLLPHIKKAKKVVRLTKRDGSPSWAVKIDFDLPILPETVWIGLQEFAVRPYVAPVLTCSTCGRLGHTKHTCASKSLTCRRCGQGKHKAADCKNPSPHCVNCGGKHSAAWQGCPEIELRKRANQIKAEKYIVYSEAIRRAKLAISEEEVARNRKHQEKPKVEHDPFWRPEAELVHPPINSPTRTYARIVGAPAAQLGGTSKAPKPGQSRVEVRQGSEPAIKTTTSTTTNTTTPRTPDTQKRVKKLQEQSKKIMIERKLERKRLESVEKNITEKLSTQLSKQFEELTKKINETINAKIEEVKKRLFKEEEVQQIKQSLATERSSKRENFVASTLIAVSRARESGDPSDLITALMSAYPGSARENTRVSPNRQRDSRLWLLAKYASEAPLSDVEWRTLKQQFGILTQEETQP